MQKRNRNCPDGIICPYCGKVCKDVSAHQKDSAHCKIFQRNRAIAQCIMGIMPDLPENWWNHKIHNNIWKSEVWAEKPPHEFVKGWDALCRENPLADEQVKKQWRNHLEEKRFPEHEIQRIRKMISALKDQGYCSLDRKLRNSKIPKNTPEDTDWSDLPGLEQWNEEEQRWEAYMPE